MAGGWGSADVGGAWSTPGPGYAVSPGAATIAANSSGETNWLPSVSLRDVDLLVKTTPPATSGSWDVTGIGVRSQASGSAYYQLSVYYAPGNNGGDYTVQLKVEPADASLGADFNTSIPSPSPLWLRLDAQGAGPTTLRWKVWKDGAGEPGSWMGSATDGTPALQAAGSVGVKAWASSGTAVVAYSSLVATAQSTSPSPSPSPSPTPSPPPPGFTCATGSLECDTFNRTVAGGWGTADSGDAWTILDTPSSWSVSQHTGSVVAGPGSQQRAVLGTASAQDVEILARVALPRGTQTGTDADAYVLGRYAGGSSPTYYRVGVGQGAGTPDVFVRAQRSDGSTVWPDTDAGFIGADGAVVWLRVQLQGAAPTSVRARAWKDGTAEPSWWQVDTLDTAAGLQGAGQWGVRSWDGDTSAAHTFGWQGFQVTALPTRPALPNGFAVDTFDRTVSGNWGAADTGGAWTARGPGWNVTPGAGTTVVNAQTVYNFLTATSVQDVDALVLVAMPPISGAYVDGGVIVRYASGTGDCYQVSAYYSTNNNNGNYTVQLKRKPSNTLINPDVNTAIPGGTAVWFRMEAQGTNPTTLRWKIWQDGTSEPAGWMGTGTDSTPGFQGPGGVGIQGYSSSTTPTEAYGTLSAVGL